MDLFVTEGPGISGQMKNLITLYPYTDIVTDIKIRRLEWLDHLIRKEIIEYPRLP
jgi:hypothetical protein